MSAADEKMFSKHLIHSRKTARKEEIVVDMRELIHFDKNQGFEIIEEGSNFWIA